MWTQGTGCNLLFIRIGHGSPYATGLVFGAGTSDGSHLTISASSGAFTTPQLETGPVRWASRCPAASTRSPLPGGLTLATSLLNLDVTAGAGGVDIPAIWPEIAASADAARCISPAASRVSRHPGHWNSTITPSSGFFNAGAGGDRASAASARAPRAGWRLSARRMAGAGSGFANVGTLHSGVLSLGSNCLRDLTPALG